MLKRIACTFIMACLIALHATAQNDTRTAHDKNGQTALDECLALYAMKSKTDIAPQLRQLAERIEQSDSFEADAYFYASFILLNLYKTAGDTYSAKALMDKAVKVFRERMGGSNPKLLLQLINADAMLKSGLMNCREALDDYNEARRIHDEAGIHDLSYVYTLQNISLMHQRLGDIKAAKEYMELSAKAYAKLNGNLLDTADPNDLTLVANYGMTSYLSGDSEKAERCFRHVMLNATADNRAWPVAAGNLAAIMAERGRYDESLSIIADMKAAGYGRLENTLQTQTVGYAFKNNADSAATSLAEYNRAVRHDATDAFAKFSRTACENYWTNASKHLTFLNNWIAAKFHTPATAASAYDNLLFTKTLLLGADILVDNSVRQSGNDTLLNMLENCKRDRATAIYKTTSAEQRRLLAARIATREDSLVHSIGNMAETLNSMAGTWQDVRRMLGDDEAAIEFTYIPVANKRLDCATHYGAFVITSDCKAPQFVMLGSLDSIDSMMQISYDDRLAINNLYTPANMQRFYNMLWRDIEPLVRKKHTLYYTVTRQLANINLEMLTDRRGRRLSQRYRMRRLSSTNLIGRMKSCGKAAFHSAALYGDVKYSETEEEMTANARKYSTFSGGDITEQLRRRGETQRGLWGDIPATAAELDSIKLILAHSGITATVYRQGEANEDAVKQLDGHAPDILHFATHGFTIDTPEKADSYRFGAVPLDIYGKDAGMVFSGLLLAGANNAWNGGRTLGSAEDGVLTADEIARLNLSGTKLVVLSACETARGMVDAIDGVFGLQRAFKRAGAESIVMSLWQVDDNATCLLMAAFYRLLAQGAERHEALNKAMMQVRNTYHDPYYWAGFIMLD